MRPSWGSGNFVALCAALSTACGSEPPEALDTTVAAAIVCPAGATVRGIDVSVYQGTVDWEAARDSGIAFGIARISDGLSHPDARFDANWAGMRKAGIVRGAYQFFEPGSDAAAQADLVVGKVGQLGPGDLPVQLDVETDGGRSGAEIAAQMALWIDRVTAGTGKRPMIYTARYFWDGTLRTTEFASYALWVASWDVACPTLPDEWSGWSLWQTGSSSSVSGVGTECDVDVFDGTLDELDAFAGRDALGLPVSGPACSGP